MTFKVYPQLPKRRKTPLIGSIHLDAKEKTAFVFDDNGKGHSIAELIKAEIVFIGGEGLLLRGFEVTGMDRQKREKLSYQEWYCVFPKEETPNDRT